jgi:hypothetical protein
MALAAPGIAEGLKKLHCSWTDIRIIPRQYFSINLNAICFDFARQSHIERFTPASYISNLYTMTIDIPLSGRRRSRDVTPSIPGGRPVEESAHCTYR